MTYSSLKIRFHNLLWEVDLDSMPWIQAEVIKYLRIFQAVLKDLAEGLPTLRAMSLVYTTLLSLVPLLAVSFSVLKGFGMHNAIEPMLLPLLAPLGTDSAKISQLIISFVDNIKVGVLGSMGIALLFYTVVSLIQKIERAFNHTWRIKNYRGFAQRISDYLSIVLVGPVLVLSALGITAAISNSHIAVMLANIEPFGTLIYIAGRLLPYIMVISAFTFIYILIPNTKVEIRSALAGGIFAGILWQAAGWLFTSFVAGSSNYTAVYSGFAILIIFMIWLYLSWLILLIGASISFYHQHPERITARQQVLGLSARLREKIALLSMFRIGKGFHTDDKLWTLTALSMNLDISSEALSMVLNALQSNHLLIQSFDNNKVTYIPSRSLEHITIKDILQAARSAEETTYLTPDNLNQEPEINTLISNLDKSIDNTLKDMTLRDLVTGNIELPAT